MHSFFTKGATFTSAKKSKDPSHNATKPWVEKYRPKKVDDLVAQDEVVAVLKKCIQGADLPNLLFYGPPGTGKTSAAVALCCQLFRSADAYKDRVLELNASDERGIDVVRNRIKNFARQTVNTHLTDVAIPGLRIIILDEADAMTNAAQSALRRTMETESQTTRFFLICNYVSRIIEPLTSRCAKFRFKPLTQVNQIDRLRLICSNESIDIEDSAYDTLIEISCGDLRKSITILQSISVSGKRITSDDVRELSGVVPTAMVERLLAVCYVNDFNELQKVVKEFRAGGYGITQLLLQFSDLLIADEGIKSATKARIFSKIAEVEKNLHDGSSEYLALLQTAVVVQEQLAANS